MQKTDTTIYEYEMSNLGASYENPRKETLENYKERKGFITDQEVIDHLNAWGGKYFIGTQAEYEVLNTPIEVYYIEDKNSTEIKYITITPLLLLNAGKVDMSFAKTVLPTHPNAIEKTKVEYDTYMKPINDKIAFDGKLYYLKQNSSPKLAAYIKECETYMSEHIGDVKAPTLNNYLLPNGKVDKDALGTTIKDNQVKADSIALLCEAYLSWIVLIEKGTQAGLDELPETDPTKLNAIIDTLWKAEHDKERKALIAKLNSSEAEFAIVDKYLVVTQGDEPEIT